MARALLVLCAALVGVAAQKPDMEQDVPDFVMACVDSSRWVYGDSNACEDDSGWIKHDGNGNKDCAWIAAEVAAGDTGRQCERAKNKKKVKAEDACACACPQATNPPNDCAWVGEDTDARCGLSLDLTGAEACPKTCGDGIEDSETWYLGETHKNCDFPPRPRALFETSPLVRTQVSGSARIRTRSRNGATKWAMTRRWRRARSRATPRAR